MTGSLNDLEFLGRCKLNYTDDLRRVQFNLNEVPHVKRDPCCGADAVAALFDGVAPDRTRHRLH